MARRTHPRGYGRKPGQSARERQEALASANPTGVFLAQLEGVHTAEQAWDAGAKGEERVGRLLNRLRADGWLVMHDLKISRHGKNVDHLVIGPTGVFVIDTKNVRGEVRVDGPSIQVDGRSRDYIERLKDQARLVREELIEELGWDTLWVQGLLVFVAPDLEVNEQPGNVGVLTDEELLPTLVNWDQRLSTAQMEALAYAARAIWL